MWLSLSTWRLSSLARWRCISKDERKAASMETSALRRRLASSSRLLRPPFCLLASHLQNAVASAMSSAMVCTQSGGSEARPSWSESIHATACCLTASDVRAALGAGLANGGSSARSAGAGGAEGAGVGKEVTLGFGAVNVPKAPVLAANSLCLSLARSNDSGKDGGAGLGSLVRLGAVGAGVAATAVALWCAPRLRPSRAPLRVSMWALRSAMPPCAVAGVPRPHG